MGKKTKKNSPKKQKKVFHSQEFEGRVCMTREGYAFIRVEGREDDIFVAQRNTRGALHGDIVRVVTTHSRGTGKNLRVDGEIIAVLERSPKPHIGILRIGRHEAWLMVESASMPYDIYIPLSDIEKEFGKDYNPKEINGLMAAARVESWPRNFACPTGTLVAVLGAPGANDTRMHAILTEFGLPYRFEPEVEREAERIPSKITREDIKDRRDFREILTYTIDPADAKDFDDAISWRRLDNGHYELGVHIADVSHYVTEGSLIDKCALERGTSVYLADRTVPMLPEVLCNRLCSLRPGEDKLCFAAVFEIGPKGKVYGSWIGRTIIRSQHRLDYEQAQKMIEGGDGPIANELREAMGVAMALKAERIRKGAIEFERPEMKVVCDEQGKPVDVFQKISKEANWLIEEFMLLANRTVAEFVGKPRRSYKPKPFVYRVHEDPNEEKLHDLHRFAHSFRSRAEKGRFPELTGDTARDLNTLLASVKGRVEQDAVTMMALRCMARARYTTEHIGHYGLAFDYYTHFTSPIRRYPDLMVHRLLAKYLAGEGPADELLLEQKCRSCSSREQLATEAERASIKFKLCEYMKPRIGESFEGTVSGVTEHGMYVEIEPSKVEGMVLLRDVEGDFLKYDERSFSIYSLRNHKRYTLGTKVRVQLTRASVEQKQIDFKLL